MFELLHYAGWYAKCRLLGKKIPIQSVVFITSRCNLNCKHCAIAKGVAEGTIKAEDFTFLHVMDLLKQCYDAGSRMVTFEGGEPLLWQDGSHNLEDLVKEAKRIGFISTSYSTNGTLPIPNSSTDRIFVSLDGTKEFHDEIRGSGNFDLVMHNIEKSSYSHISVNTVVNNINWECIPDLINLVAETRNIKSISINFHTPHRGVENLFLHWDKRRQVLDQVIKLKKDGYPIANSLAALKRMCDNTFTKRCWITNFVLPDGRLHPQCPGAEEGVCDRCGYGMGAEMSALFDLAPSTIREGLKLFSKV